MNSGVLPDDKKELSSNEAKLIMIDVPWTSTVWLSAKFDWITV